MNEDEDRGVVIVCQGPSRCDLTDDAAVEAAQAGCVWCKRITIHADGSESIAEPVEA